MARSLGSSSKGVSIKKKTKQGQGTHSKPKGDRKLSRGQGRK